MARNIYEFAVLFSQISAPCPPFAFVGESVTREVRRLFHAHPFAIQDRAPELVSRGRFIAGTCGEGQSEQADRRLRSAERALHLRLQSEQLVHRLHMRERSIDADAVLAMLSAERALSRAALLNLGAIGLSGRPARNLTPRH